ncbi:PepSY domain-containing protein [Isoptericola sp. 4D.3]|uniref:PepSY domain-containing protein n=1 Tax=Isoptericola peretonis TaxID=2918523 RepID=A0ABT0J4K9_9MICO|nr:PepSY domain-containing protein [Isoptericola sp. 4D.3]
MTIRTARRIAVPAALALSLGLALTACADDSGDGSTPADETTTSAGADDGASPGTDDTDDTATDDDASPSASASPEHRTAAGLLAIATAEKKAGGTAFAIDDPDRDNTWEVDVATGKISVEVEVSADGTEVVRTEEDDLDADDRRALADAKFSITQAIERTVATAGGDLDDAELDEDDGRYHWSVTVLVDGAETDFRVGLQDGKVAPEPDDND